MNWIEGLIIVSGISLDIFAAMEIEGAMLQQVKKSTLAIVSALVTALQLTFFFGGYAVCYWLTAHGYFADSFKEGSVLATVIFAALGIRLIVKAVRSEFINETRREIKVRGYIRIIAVASLYTIFAGCACGMIGISPISTVITIIACSVVVVIAGLYTGFHYGFELKTKAYIIGAVLLWIAGADLLLKNVFDLI